MTVDELLFHLTRIFFVGLALVTFVSFLTHRDRIRRDIFLVFFALNVTTLIGILGAVTRLDVTGIAQLGSLALIAQPLLTLRLVQYFRAVPPFVYWSAAVSMLVSWAAVILLGSLLPTLWTELIIAYFVVFDGYAVVAFIYGAFSSAGVVRHRLRFAAAGSFFLILVFITLGLNIAFPALQPLVTPLTQVLSIASAIAYYLGFAPPRWLTQAWQHTELRTYLQGVQTASSRNLDGILAQLVPAVIRGIGTNVVTVRVALWDERLQKIVLQKSEQPSIVEFPLTQSFQDAWQQQRAIILDKSPRVRQEDVRLLRTFNAETILIVPITTYEQRFGLLILFLQNGSLFMDEDVRLLTIFAQQAATLLQNQRMIEALYRQTQELEATVKARTRDLERSNEELKMFASIASHDLQEPLRTITSYMQLVELRYADKLDDDGREFITFAVDGAARMKKMITDVLTYARVETQSKNFTLFDSQAIVDEVRQSLHVAIAEAGATITADPMPRLNGDKRLILQLFQNLVSNAIKYRGAKPPQIHIGAIQKPDHWLFSVADNGIGIETAYLDQIFIVFRRFHNKHKYQGTGIGLAICKKAVELHGGRIWAESQVDHGTTFYFSLPTSHETFVGGEGMAVESA